MIVLGLTGSIGMGKTTTARMFAEAGVPVADSDAIVHRLYAGKAVAAVEALFPGVAENGEINRQKLAAHVVGQPDNLKRLEAVIHPMVQAEQQAFLDQARLDGHRLALLDIPLLFETGAEKRVDKVIVVSADPDTQRRRVLARPGMSVEKFEALLAKQMPDQEKRRRADWVIDTSHGLDAARAAVHAIVADLEHDHA
jgi:dephospho-CoA kinase